VNEYKALKEREEEERQAEEMERLRAEAEEKRLMSAELTARFRDRVREFVSEHRRVSVNLDIGVVYLLIQTKNHSSFVLADTVGWRWLTFESVCLFVCSTTQKRKISKCSNLCRE